MLKEKGGKTLITWEYESGGQNIPGINTGENNVTEGELVRVQGFCSPNEKQPATVVHIHTPVHHVTIT